MQKKLIEYRRALKRAIKAMPKEKPWDRGMVAGYKAALHYFEVLFVEELKQVKSCPRKR